MVEVCLPGTSGMIPLLYRCLACCWIEYNSKAFLIDCGEGTQIALQKCGCKIDRLDTLMITHFHTDHVAGLSGLLTALSNSGKRTALHIIGPAGLKKVISFMLIFTSDLPFDIKINEIADSKTGKIETDDAGETEISYLMLRHGITCYGYSVTIKSKPVIPPKTDHLLKLPKELFRILHTVIPVKSDDGHIMNQETAADGGNPAISVCYCTDTLPVDEIADFARGADLFICEGLYGNENKQDRVVKKGHMLFSDSARLAKKAGVKCLWLTHYGPRMLHPEKYIHNARRIFPNTIAGHDGIRIRLGK